MGQSHLTFQISSFNVKSQLGCDDKDENYELADYQNWVQNGEVGVRSGNVVLVRFLSVSETIFIVYANNVSTRIRT